MKRFTSLAAAGSLLLKITVPAPDCHYLFYIADPVPSLYDLFLSRNSHF